MEVFESARIRLTFWYLLIIAIICISFSAIIYRDISLELTQGFLTAESKLRAQSLPQARMRVRILLEDELVAAKKTILIRLVFVNSLILLVSGVGGYFLAGKTLQPIELAVSEQKRFVSDASHELKTPMTSLRTEIEVALMDKKLNLRQARAVIKSNLEEVDKMQKLTNYLLSLSRYESGTTKLAKKRVDIASLAVKLIGKYKKLAINRKVELTSNLSETWAMANATSVEELISILLNNAVKYTQAGGRVGVTVKPSGKYAVIEVADTGIGIKHSEIPYIFSRFYRGDLSRSKTETDGYGLGLSIAKSIVDLHLGRIKVKSVVGKGSIFKVILPA